MDNINATICNMISNSLWGFDEKIGAAPLSMADWTELKAELNSQTVAGIPLEYMMNNMALEEDVKADVSLTAFAQVGAWTRLMEAQQNLINLLADNGIDMAVIKGIVAGVNYPKPEYRAMGDVDFFVRKKDFDRTFQLLLDNGYEAPDGDFIAAKEISDDKYHHVELTKDGVIFELHKAMASAGTGRAYDEYFHNIIEESLDHIDQITVDRYTIPVFPTMVNGLIFIRHIIQHLAESKGIGLRHLLDWMMFVDKYVDDDYWYGGTLDGTPAPKSGTLDGTPVPETGTLDGTPAAQNSFQSCVDSIGLKDAAIVMTRICQLHLGLSAESITWCADADEQLCEDIFSIIMNGGNFGRKNAQENEGANVLYKNKSVFGFFASLQDLGIRNWAFGRKHAVLRPFAWLYQICRYIRKGLFRKHPIRSLREDIAKSKGKRTVIERLNVKKDD